MADSGMQAFQRNSLDSDEFSSDGQTEGYCAEIKTLLSTIVSTKDDAGFIAFKHESKTICTKHQLRYVERSYNDLKQRNDMKCAPFDCYDTITNILNDRMKDENFRICKGCICEDLEDSNECPVKNDSYRICYFHSREENKQIAIVICLSIRHRKDSRANIVIERIKFIYDI